MRSRSRRADEAKARAGVPGTIGEYIASSAPATRTILRKILRTIRKAVPGAEEGISYRMPTFRSNGVLLHVAAFREHIGVFPPVRGDAALMKRLAPYAGPKGNLRFPLDGRIPYALIAQIAKVRARQNDAKAALRKAKRERAR